MSSGIKILSMTTVVPQSQYGMEDLVERFNEENARKIVNATGVLFRHSSKEKKTLDLAFEAGKIALARAGVKPEDVDGIILVTQTPEYRLPSTSCILQDRLGLPKASLAFDISLGCSGFPYGLITANSLLSSGTVSRLLLISGDVTSMNASPEDKSTYPLFSDGFAAVLLERCREDGDLLGYSFGTDGSGWKNMVIHVGMARHPKLEDYYQSGGRESYPEVRYPDYAYMDGGQIFTFCLREVPSMIRRALESSCVALENVDFFFFHQANVMIIRHLAKKMKIPEEKAPISIDRYGNTSSSSPVLTACDHLGDKGIVRPLTVVMAAFGVGYSWASVVLKLDPSVICGIREV